jgi:hypothetical protein
LAARGRGEGAGLDQQNQAHQAGEQYDIGAKADTERQGADMAAGTFFFEFGLTPSALIPSGPDEPLIAHLGLG